MKRCRGRSKEVLRVGWTRVRLGLPNAGGIATTTATTTMVSVYSRGRFVQISTVYYSRVLWGISDLGYIYIS